MNDRSNESNGADRRGFLKGATLGAIGTMAATSAFSQNLVIPHQGKAEDVQKPKGLNRRAMLDQRFPVAYQNSVPQAVSCVIQFFAALSERNLKGMADVMHFPFGSFEASEAVRVNSPDDLLAHAPASMNMSLHPERFTDHDGYLKPGAYDVFEGLEVLCTDPICCALAMTYNRYDSNGRRLHRCEGIYSVTNNDGRWAIQAMSTIFTPDRMVGIVLPDVIEAVKRLRIDHDLAYNVSDRSVEPALLPGAGAGSRLGVNGGGSPWNLGPAGRAMDQFKVVGIKSRLTITTAEEAAAAPRPEPAPSEPKTRQQELADYASYRQLMGSTTGEEWGWVYGVIPETRIIHHTVSKAHRFSAAVRFTASGEPISTNTDLAVALYRKRQWISAGNFAYTTPHDRANDIDVPGALYVPPPTAGRGGRGGRGQ